MKYRFEQFNVEIDNPVVTIVNVADAINLKTCSVDVVLFTDSAQFGVNLQGFEYTETWEDSDIEAWVTIELQKYEV
jgi:hypothetical protein